MTSETSQSPTESTATPSIFRTASEPTESAPLPETDRNQPTTAHETADGLFIGYEVDNSVPLIVDVYGLRDSYKQDPEAYSEVIDINRYLENLVNSGQLDNSVKAVTEKIKQLEKLSGVDSTERVNMKLTRLAEYAKFENRINDAKRNSIKWSR
jgi:hypothetical protein